MSQLMGPLEYSFLLLHLQVYVAIVTMYVNISPFVMLDCIEWLSIARALFLKPLYPDIKNRLQVNNN